MDTATLVAALAARAKADMAARAAAAAGDIDVQGAAPGAAPAPPPDSADTADTAGSSLPALESLPLADLPLADVPTNVLLAEYEERNDRGDRGAGRPLAGHSIEALWRVLTDRGYALPYGKAWDAR